MGATNVLASGAPCFIIRQIRAPVAQILDQCLQAIGIFRLWTIGLEQRQGFIELAPPEMVEELAQQCLLRHPPTRNQAGQFVAFLTEVIPVHNQFAARPAGDLGLKERGDPASAVFRGGGRRHHLCWPQSRRVGAGGLAAAGARSRSPLGALAARAPNRWPKRLQAPPARVALRLAPPLHSRSDPRPWDAGVPGGGLGGLASRSAAHVSAALEPPPVQTGG